MRRSTTRAAIPTFATGATFAALAAGCVSPAIEAPPRLLTVRPMTAPYTRFPAARARTTDDATLCATIGSPDTTIAHQRATTQSRYLGSLSMRLPVIYVLTPMPDDLSARSEAVGGTLVASWRLDDGEERAPTAPRGVSVWVVPDDALPTVGADPQTRQVAFARCPGIVAGRPARMALFTLVARAESTTYLAAVWPAPRGRHVQLLAAAPNAAALDPVRRALVDAVLTAPAPR